jgi:hypothetical protein
VPSTGCADALVVRWEIDVNVGRKDIEAVYETRSA